MSEFREKATGKGWTAAVTVVQTSERGNF